MLFNPRKVVKKSAKLIDDYIYKKRINKSEFCRMCKIARSTLHVYLEGKDVDVNCAKKIEKGTNGEISAKELLF